MVAGRAGMMLAMVAAAVIAAACGSFGDGGQPDGVSLDGSADSISTESAVDSGTGGGNGDGGGGDGGGGDGGDGDGGPANLLINGGFEQGCAPWKVNSATLKDDKTARSGTKSCLVCGTAGAGSWSINQEVPRALVAGGTYTAEAWVRTPLSGPPANPISCPLEARDAVGKPLQAVVSTPTDATSTWARFSETFTLTDAGAAGIKLHMGVIANMAGGCFLIDDAALYLVP